MRFQSQFGYSGWWKRPAKTAILGRLPAVRLVPATRRSWMGPATPITSAADIGDGVLTLRQRIAMNSPKRFSRRARLLPCIRARHGKKSEGSTRTFFAMERTWIWVSDYNLQATD